MIYDIPPGLFCAPAAIVAVTGEDPESVVCPALNRATGGASPLSPVAGVRLSCILRALRELGWEARAYRHADLVALVSTWADRSLRYPERPLMLSTRSHVMIAQNGRVWDNWSPHGPSGEQHPWARRRVTQVHLLQKIAR